jgi:endonuclease/exonuclease/phosphatase family metal-dependent hydrolase
MKARIATFNAENLFARFKFKGKRVKKPSGGYTYRDYTDAELKNVVDEGWDVDEMKFTEFSEDDRRITGSAVRETDADVLALQEIESLDTLKRFTSQRLRGAGYTYKILIDGNDPRLIDVAVLSRYPFAYIRTHQFGRTQDNRSFVFSRDCLEVGVQLSPNTVLPLFVNHFKSMMGGRGPTMARRRIQAEAVVAILKERFGANPGAEPWVVVGDLNDYLPSTGLEPLLGTPWLENVVDRIGDPTERWTHYWDDEEEYRQLDYLLLSKALADANPNAVPEIVRKGMPRRAARYTGPRFDGVGENRPKASDHCPVVLGFDL